MLRVETILFPTDFSELSLAALPYAKALAGLLGAEVLLAHACEHDGQMARVHDYLESLASGMGDLRRRALVGFGSPVDFLVDLAARHERSWIVMASHGRRGAARRVLGSTAESVASRTPCPVLTVKEPDLRFVHGDSGLRIPRLLVPTDFSGTSLAALEAAGELARKWDAEVVLLHVMRPRDSGDPFRRRAAADMMFQVARRIRPAEVRFFLETGSPRRVIAQIAEREGVGMILQGTRGRRTVAGIRLRSSARAIIRRSPCPVLTLHGRHKIPKHSHPHSHAPAAH